MASLGLGWEDVHRRWPSLIMASISGYGNEGPNYERAAMDIIVQAGSGIMAVVGNDEDPAMLEGMCDMNAGLHAVIGIQGALFSRMTDGLGRYVDISMADCAVSLLQTQLPMASNGDHDERVMDGSGGRVGTITRTLAPFDTFMCADAKIALVGYQQHHWLQICELIGRPDLAERFPELRDRTYQWGESPSTLLGLGSVSC